MLRKSGGRRYSKQNIRKSEAIFMNILSDNTYFVRKTWIDFTLDVKILYW